MAAASQGKAALRVRGSRCRAAPFQNQPTQPMSPQPYTTDRMPDAAQTDAILSTTELPEGADFVDRVFAYLLAEFPQMAGPRFSQAERAVREELAGERVYVQARGASERQALAREVLSLFDGRNASEVARRLNIGRATVYRLLKQSRRP